MLHWIENYYVGEGIKNPEKIKKKLDSGRYVHGICLLTLSHTPGNLMEILPASLLKQQSLRELCPPIIGMAKDKERAIEMVSGILTDAYRRTGGFAPEEFLKNR